MTHSRAELIHIPRDMTVLEAARGFGNGVALVLYTILFFIPTLVGALIRRPQLGRWAVRTHGRVNLWTSGITADISGLEHIPDEGGFVLIANHESHYDGLALMALSPRPLCVVAKRELFKVPVLGWGFTAAGFISLDRGDRNKALESMGQAEARLRSGEAVLVFPEGTRSTTTEMLPFKRGGIATAMKAEVPLIPVGIAGTREVLPPGEVLSRPGPVHLCIGPPIPTEGLSWSDRHQLTDDARAAIESLRRDAAQHLNP